MSLAEKIQAAQASEGGVYLTLGEYEVTVQNIIYRQNTANSGECLIAELLVDQSNNDAHPVGAKRSSVFTLVQDLGRGRGQELLLRGHVGQDPGGP